MASKLDVILGRIAIGGGIITIGTGFFLYNRLQNQYRYAEYVTEPVRILQGYPYAEQILGKPINPLNIKFDPVNVRVGELETRITIPVKGSKAKAMLFSLCQKSSPDSEWEVKQLDLQLDPKTPKWTFYKQAGFEGPETDTDVIQTQVSVKQVDSDSKVSKDNLPDKKKIEEKVTKIDSKSSDSERKKREEKQTSMVETDDKKKLRWL